jgi:hypothetical protein
MNQATNKLQLQVDIFCQDVCDGVREWMNREPGEDPTVNERLNSLLQVYSIESEIRM